MVFDMSEPENKDYRDYWKKLNQQDSGEDPRSEQYWNGPGDRGYRTTGDPNYGPIPEEYQSNSMSRAALTCGIIAVISIFFSFIFVGVSFIAGALGLIFAFLSRKNRFNRQARTAIGLCAAGMIAFTLMFGISFGILYTTGMWDTLVEKAQSIDPDDPTSVTVAQQEIMDELMKKYGLKADSAGTSA